MRRRTRVLKCDECGRRVGVVWARTWGERFLLPFTRVRCLGCTYNKAVQRGA